MKKFYELQNYILTIYNSWDVYNKVIDNVYNNDDPLNRKLEIILKDIQDITDWVEDTENDILECINDIKKLNYWIYNNLISIFQEAKKL